ncbi:xanthine dehydrogenase family protein subunit M [Pedobacter petrophilus]|uniref:Xanthine dehydrogenase family protein subunit M n=1 Tax=Pedobacter petrophilus TaxID=1908241 RepID=A0A7K0G6G2_9SPHI|nr:xanthine dehydrogenase family protein subunit M [Pedobacter petrophilus]MRX78789.1 xanthine dehydrogenase family protein subunit M [Pedobacter petrophilus]
MTPFKFSIAENPSAAIGLLQKNNSAAFLAGGTNILDLMKEHVTNPTEIIDLGRLQLNTIKPTTSGISLGALAKNTETANHPIIRKDYPLLSKAILAGASAQIRNMASNGGNLLQRTRCSYFYDIAMPCNKRVPGSGCAAMEGFNRMHAIFGWSEKCVAVYPSDMAVALSALNASVKVMQQNGNERIIPFGDFHVLPKDHPEKDNSLNFGELITTIDLPKNNFAGHAAYVKVRDRNSYAFALVSVAAGLDLQGNTINQAQIAMGGVAHKPWRALNAEAFLKGKQATKVNFTKAAELEMSAAKPLSHNQFKIEMGKQTLINALEMALKG